MIKMLKDICVGDNKDRFNSIVSILNSLKIDHDIYDYGNGKNIYIHFGQNKFKNLFIAHHDKIELAPGANDNGAAIIELIYFAEYLKNNNINKDLTICFTDNEENLTRFENLEHMGSYKIIEDHNSKIESVVVFDACGIGDSLIISYNKFNNYYHDVIMFTDSYIIKTPYSDNYCFDLFYIPSILVSFIPYKEIMGEKKTWKLMHTEFDNVDSIDESTLKLAVATIKQIFEVIQRKENRREQY